MFPAEEARKASQRVQETISEKGKELDTLDSFIIDNTNLINLVQRLPDELHHQIMVSPPSLSLLKVKHGIVFRMLITW